MGESAVVGLRDDDYRPFTDMDAFYQADSGHKTSRLIRMCSSDYQEASSFFFAFENINIGISR